MAKMKFSLPQIKLAFAISWALLGFAPAQAVPVKSVTVVQRPTFNSSAQLNKALIFNAPPPPNDINAPSNRTAGGKRGCGSLGKPLTALVPVYGAPDSEFVLGLTTAEHPTFWFYVPYLPTVSGEFVLQNEAQQTIYQTPISLLGTPGIVSLSLPSTAPPLETGKLYRWYFSIYCQPQQPPIFVDGWIKRESLNLVLKSQLEQATSRQRIALFADRGIWYDALTASAELQYIDSQPTDWAVLLKSVGLENIASEPMVKCCQVGSR